MCCKSGGGLSRQNVYGSGGRRLIPCDNTVIKPLLSCVHRIDFLDSVVSGHKSDGRKILYSSMSIRMLFIWFSPCKFCSYYRYY